MTRLFHSLFSLTFLLLIEGAAAQDMERTIDDLPSVSAILLRVLEKSPSFAAQADVRAAYREDSKPTNASGSCAWQNGMIRWDLDSRKIEGPLAPARAMSLVAQLKLAPLILIARADRQTSDFILGGGQACLETKLAETSQIRRSAAGEEQVDGKRCLRERLQLKLGKREVSAMLWKLKAKPSLPARLKLAAGDLSIDIHFRNARAGKQPADRFEIPPGFTKHSALEEVVQSVMIEKMRSKFGLPSPR